MSCFSYNNWHHYDDYDYGCCGSRRRIVQDNVLDLTRENISNLSTESLKTLLGVAREQGRRAWIDVIEEELGVRKQ